MPVPRGKNDRPTKLSMTELLPELYEKKNEIKAKWTHVINIYDNGNRIHREKKQVSKSNDISME